MRKNEMVEQNNLEEVLIEKKVKFIKENIKAQKLQIDFPAFPLEYLPKSFANVKKEEVSFSRKALRKRSVPKIEKFFDLRIYLEVDCYLLNPSQYAEDILKFVFLVLEGIAFKNKKNIKDLKIRINDVAKDPYNQGQNYIGIVIKEFKEKKHPDKIVLEP